MASHPLIHITDLIKSYHLSGITTQVLKKISLSVYQGDLLAIVGASGSGKSTLMNIIGLLDVADAGEYVLQQKPIHLVSEEEQALLRNQHIGFVFQQFHLLPRFTAKQNVALPLTYRNLSASDIEEKVLSALKKVGMHNFAHHKPTQLSGGQQQRVAIARALVTEPQVILADEPTGALDSSTGIEIFNLFLNLHAEGRTIIIITHDNHLASQCTRRIILSDGQIICEERT